MQKERDYDLGSRVKPGNDNKINPPHQLRWFTPSAGGELSGFTVKPWDDKRGVTIFFVLLLLSFHGSTMESRCMRIEKRYDLGSRVKPGNDKEEV